MGYPNKNSKKIQGVVSGISDSIKDILLQHKLDF